MGVCITCRKILYRPASSIAFYNNTTTQMHTHTCTSMHEHFTITPQHMHTYTCMRACGTLAILILYPFCIQIANNVRHSYVV